MTENGERTHNEIYEKVGDHNARLLRIERDVVEMKADVRSLIKALNMGRGGMWVAMKIGGFLVLLVAALSWVYEKVRHLFG